MRIDLQVYAGRYIALVEGRVAGVGLTARGAFTRARRSRPKRMPVVFKVGEPSRSLSDVPPRPASDH